METNSKENGYLNIKDPKSVLNELETKIQELFQSKDYIKFLQKMSLLHDYSFNNIILILMQKPDASMVASFATFNQMHRRVVKGSKAIKVLCPCPTKLKRKIETKDENGQVVFQETEENRLLFKFGNVFDISQTVPVDEEGVFKTCFAKELQYNSTFIQTIISNIKKSITIPIEYDSTLNGSRNGYYKIDSKEIFIRQGMSHLQELKTLVHELAHHYQHTNYGTLIKTLDRNDLEVSAESTAYVVLKMLSDFYGVPEIDSSDYSVGYVASWSKDKTLQELKTTLTLISKISNDLFKVISTAIPQVM